MGIFGRGGGDRRTTTFGLKIHTAHGRGGSISPNSPEFHSALVSISTTHFRFHRTPVPIRPTDGFGIPTLESGNNTGTLRVPFPFFMCFCVPSRTYKSLKFQIKVLCHGRGREFESRRPRHSFNDLQQTQKRIWVRLGPISFEALRPPRIPSNNFWNAFSNTNY